LPHRFQVGGQVGSSLAGGLENNCRLDFIDVKVGVLSQFRQQAAVMREGGGLFIDDAAGHPSNETIEN
jgi:hypothetical protein